MKKINVTYHMHDNLTTVETCITLPISRWRYNILKLNEYSLDEEIVLIRNDVVKDLENLLEALSRIQSFKFTEIAQIEYMEET